MQIRTTKIAATDTKGARIRAKCPEGQLTLPYPHESNYPHRDVALELARKVKGPHATVTEAGDTTHGYVFDILLPTVP